MTYMLLLNCALKLVEEIILYYDARSKKHQITLYSCTVIEVVFCNSKNSTEVTRTALITDHFRRVCQL